VTLVWAGPDGALGTGDDVTFTTTTDAGGNYQFSGLPVSGASDTYRVSVVAPASFPALSDSIDDGVLSATNPATIALAPAQARTDADFGFRGTGVFGDVVFLDSNGNGRQDAGEQGVQGVTVQLFFYRNGNGDFLDPSEDVPLLTTTTGPGGTYS